MQDETILHGKFESWHLFAFYELVTGLKLSRKTISISEISREWRQTQILKHKVQKLQSIIKKTRFILILFFHISEDGSKYNLLCCQTSIMSCIYSYFCFVYVINLAEIRFLALAYFCLCSSENYINKRQKSDKQDTKFWWYFDFITKSLSKTM